MAPSATIKKHWPPRRTGATNPIVDFLERVMEISKGEKLAVVSDSVGKETFMKSLDCLSPKGLVGSFGQSSR